MAAEEVCGKCGGPVVERMLSTKKDNNKHYFKKCFLCEKVFSIHHNCVTSLCKEYSISIDKPDSVVTHAEWVESEEIPFRCRFCLTSCFACQKGHKPSRHRYIADCSQCKKKWCYMLPGCVSHEKDRKCLNCMDTSNYKKILHKGGKNPFWCEKDVVLPADVTLVSNIQWGTSTNNRKKGMEFAIKRKPLAQRNQECCSCNPLNYRNDEVNSISDGAVKNLCCSNQCELHLDYVECPKKCLMGESCGNNSITNGVWKRMVVFKTEKKGLGVKALDEIKKLEFIGEYTGVIVTRNPVNNVTIEHNNYMMEYENPSLMSAKDFGSVLRFVNHSCEPNAYVQRWKVNQEQRIGVFAKKDIKVMEEITYDYQWETKSEANNEKCFCFSSNCRGTLKKVKALENVEIRCDLATFSKEQNKCCWTIHPNKIRTESKEYTDYCEFNEIDASRDNTIKDLVSYRSHVEWTQLCDNCVKYLSTQMQHRHHKESSKKLVECFSGYLEVNVVGRKCNRNRSIKEVYNTLYELLFVPVSSLHGAERIGNDWKVLANNTTNMWILSRMCFGAVNKNPATKKLIDLGHCTQTKLGKKFIKYFEGHTSLSGYNAENEIIDKNQSEPTPVQLIGNIRANNIEAFDENRTDSIVLYINSLYEQRDGTNSSKVLPILKLCLKLSLTEPSAFKNITNAEKIESNGVRFFWRCSNEALGSNWGTDIMNDSLSQDKSLSSNKDNRSVFIENKRRFCIQLGYESLVRTDILKPNVSREKSNRFTRFGKRDRPRHTSFISRIYDHSSKFDFSKLHNHINHYLGLLDDLNFKTDFTNETSCVEAIKRRFTCLDDMRDNIFLINEQDPKPLGCLYIPVISINRVVDEVFAKDINGTSGDVDDAIINFVVELLNFHQSYDRTKKLQQTNCPQYFFLGSYDDVHGINPNYTPERYKYLCDVNFLDKAFQETNKNKIESDILDWFHNRNNSELYRLLYLCEKNEWSIPNIMGCFRCGKLQYHCINGEYVNYNDEQKYLITTYKQPTTWDKAENSTCIDEGIDDSESSHSRMWLAKMISTHKRQQNHNYDFSCSQMQLKKDNVDNDVHHHVLEYPDIVDEIVGSKQCHSTGLVTLMMWVQKVSGTQRNDIYTRQNLLKLRLSIFSLIIKIHDDLCDTVNYHPWIVEKPSVIKYSRMNQIHNLYLKGKQFKLDDDDRVRLDTITEILKLPKDDYEKLLFQKENNVFNAATNKRKHDQLSEGHGEDASGGEESNEKESSNKNSLGEDASGKEELNENASGNKNGCGGDTSNEGKDEHSNDNNEEDDAPEKNDDGRNGDTKNIDSDDSSESDQMKVVLSSFLRKDDVQILSEGKRGKLNFVTNAKVQMSPDHEKTLHLVPLLKDFFLQRWFHDDRDELVREDYHQILWDWINEIVNRCTTYFCIQKVYEYDYHELGCETKFGNLISQDKDEPDESDMTESFQIVCAAVVEDNIETVDGKKAFIIHLLATHNRFEGQYLATQLLSTIVKQPMYDGKSLVFAASHMKEYSCNNFVPPKKYDYTNPRYKNLKKYEKYEPERENFFYQGMGFHFHKQKPGWYVPRGKIPSKCKVKDLVREYYQKCDDVDDLTFEHNVMCWANKVKVRENLRNRVKKYVRGTIEWCIRGASCCTHVKMEKCKDTQQNEYWMRMSHYGDMKAKHIHEITKNITVNRLRYINANENKWVECRLSGCRGSKDENNQRLLHKSMIPNAFHQTSYPDTDNCVWLAMCIAVYFIDSDEAYRLLRIMQMNPNKYDNLNIWKGCNKVKNNISPSLRSYLNVAKSKFYLQRLKVERNDYMNYVMEQCESGIYICFLKSHDNVTEHTIAINVDRKEIYDCEEKGVLNMTMENLHRCCGGSKTVKNFHLCVMLVRRKE